MTPEQVKVLWKRAKQYIDNENTGLTDTAYKVASDLGLKSQRRAARLGAKSNRKARGQ